MKIIAFSDIHANLPALEAVLEDITQFGDDVQIVIAGDLINCGAYPRETLKLLRSLSNAIIIAGNHEEYVLNACLNQMLPPYRALFAPAVWTASQLNDEEIEWLTNLPRQTSFAGPDNSEIMVVHGSPRNQTEGIRPELNLSQLETIFTNQIKPRRLWIAGHTHRPSLHRWQAMTIVNLGSLGMPFDGDSRACYLYAQWNGSDWQIEQRRVAYDRARTLQAMLINSSYDEGGPFMRLMRHNVKIAQPCAIHDFVREYTGLGDYPIPPADFPHLDEAVTRHLERYEAGHYGLTTKWI